MEGISLFTAQHKPTTSERSDIVDFLFYELGEYGDSKEAISKAIAFALKETPKSIGGFILSFRDPNKKILGAAVINETGMTDYIPENILVYIAVSQDRRGQGLGKQLMVKVQETVKGDIALHIDPQNPARHLYERMGFTQPYLEMRYKAE